MRASKNCVESHRSPQHSARLFRPLCALALAVALPSFCAGGEADLKPKGPEHNVTLAEEPGVLDLLAKAQKARDRAEKDPQVWPECVKVYAEILRKYPNTVYLDRWEGPDKTDMAWHNGLYKSTRERVNRDIASLPPAGLAIYRVINDQTARALFNEAQEQMDERKMEQVAQEYFPTTFGDSALAWLAEVSSDRGAARQVLVRLTQALKHPSPKISKMTVLTRMVLAQIHLSDRAAAEKTLKEIETLVQEGDKSELRIGHDAGPAAIEKLKARIAGLKQDSPAVAGIPSAAGRAWETYFGNAAHNHTAPARKNIGLRKWSVPIQRLLYGSGPEGAKVAAADGNQVNDPTINQHLTVQDGYFYINDAQIVAAYPIGNPQPGASSTGGNVKFLFPNELQPQNKSNSREAQIRRRFGRIVNSGIRHHPYFSTVANGRLYAVIGAEAMTMDPDMWRGQELKQTPNYLVSVGYQSGKLLWSLQPDVKAQGFEAQSKPDQEWLKSVFFVSSPTYESGVLYAMAIQSRGLNEAWVAAFDADDGKLLWKTMVCSANPYYVTGVVQPDIGLPVAVANGTVYVTTNLGAVAALDAMSGNIKWLRVYDRLQTQDRFNNRGVRSSADFWGPNPPVVYRNVLMTTPQDSDRLYAYDIETGRRVWWIERLSREDGPESTGLKHIIGIVDGNLVVSGTNVHFYEIKSGKKTAGPIDGLDSPVKGRGTVTDGIVLVPTDRALFSIDAGLENGRLKAKLRDKHPWQSPDEEAGNVFVAGDVLYTISHSHVNAYFVWEEMESKLRERIKQRGDDLSAYSELADVYHKVDRFDQALLELDKALGIAAKDEARHAEIAAELRKKKFDALFELGRRTQSGSDQVKKDPAAAYEQFKKALEVARLPGQADVLPVQALRALAENAMLRGDAAAAVQHYQEMITRHGDAIYNYAPESTSKARLFAQSRIEEIKIANPESYAKLEAEAQAAFAKAGADSAQLQALLLNYPNSSACAHALLKLAQVALEKNPDQARQFALACMSRFRGTDTAAAATAILAAAYQKGSLLGPAKDLLRRMASRKEFADKTLTFDPLNAGAKVDPPLKLSDWANQRLADPQFLRASTSATVSLGDGKLKLGWSKPAGEQTSAIAVEGIIPSQMRRAMLFAENQSELAVIDCDGRGEELWKPRPKLPADIFPKSNSADQIRIINGMRAQFVQTADQVPYAVWSGNLLVICGAREVVAYDTSEKGKVVWRKEVRSPAPQQHCSIQASYGRLVIGAPGGGLEVLDAATGESLWQTQVEGNQFLGLPALGDGFIGVAALNPAKVVIFDLETGNRRNVIDITSGNLSQPPVAIGDRLYFVERNMLIQAVDGSTGKLIWQHELSGSVTRLEATRELLVAVTDQRQITALNTDGIGPRRKWTPVLPLSATVRELHIDGEELYVATDVPQQKSKLFEFSIPKEGKIQWAQDLSSDATNSIALGPDTVAVGHVLATQSNWDATGEKAAAVVLIERKTGKLSWAENLASDQRQLDPDTGTFRATFRAQMFDGGVVITESRKRTAYVAADPGSVGESIKSIEKQLAQSPGDVELRGSLGLKQFEKGEIDQGVANISAVLNDKQVADEKFAGLYAAFARVRQEHAKKHKPGLVFSKVADGSKLDGNSASWTGVPETVLDGWRNIFFPSDDETSGTIKKGAWAGVDDLKVSFRGAYDDKNLHLLLIVSDDKHKNEPLDPSSFDLGDSVKIVFDINRDGGMGYRGEMFALGACVNAKGAVISTRWVEHGRILAGMNPLQTAPHVQRDETKNQTVYKFTLPLEYLGLKPESGRKFGFSFVVNDQDEGAMATKSIGASPGVLDPVYPSLFGEGILQEKK